MTHLSFTLVDYIELLTDIESELNIRNPHSHKVVEIQPIIAEIRAQAYQSAPFNQTVFRGSLLIDFLAELRTELIFSGLEQNSRLLQRIQPLLELYQK